MKVLSRVYTTPTAAPTAAPTDWVRRCLTYVGVGEACTLLRFYSDSVTPTICPLVRHRQPLANQNTRCTCLLHGYALWRKFTPTMQKIGANRPAKLAPASKLKIGAKICRSSDGSEKSSPFEASEGAPTPKSEQNRSSVNAT